MIVKFLVYVLITFVTSIDYVLSSISGYASLSTYTDKILTAVNSILGLLHSVAPSTTALLATYVVLWFAIWLVFFVFHTIKRFIPFLSPHH